MLERVHDKPPLGHDPSVELVGPYSLLAEIGRGELTTLYLAKRHGALGFQRLYALKRLKPALSKNPDWMELLLDEARLVSGIHHANIASVLDVGAEAHTFVVMEYIEGENLEGLLVRAGASRHPRYIVPPFVDALNGLHALHTATEEDGTPCNIVHQAPRARHILLGIDGTARLIDFSQMRGKGVRPTRCRSDRLKIAYMAPEQALHPDGVDLRADVFIAGVALWEALTGERLFGADTDEQTFQNMLHRRIPRPSEVGLRPPRCFDAICMRALERDPKNRFASAQEMARELRDTAQQQALYATTTEIGRWVRHLVGRELRERRRLAGQDALSSSEFPLETPAMGIELPKSESEPPTAQSARPEIDENPYATGRIYGGSQARIILDERAEQEKTPAFGMRRSKPLPREEEDDEPTKQHPAPTHSASVDQAAFRERVHAHAHAPTLPTTSPPVPAFAAALAETMPPPDVAASAEHSAERSDEEQTQPNRFVPARPGARRDMAAASPGAYLQVDSSRRTPRTRPSVIAPAAASSSPVAREVASPFDEEAATERRSLVPASDSVVREKGRGAASPFERRIGPITEHPPTYVQRRDSLPTRMEIPVGPVGVPHRAFGSERLPQAPRAVASGEASGQTSPGAEAPMMGLSTDASDSLTPPITATRTAPPRDPSSLRSSTLWMISGVVAALILLAVGVGLRQWVAMGAQRSSSKHAASGGPGLPVPESSRPPEPSRAAASTAAPKPSAPGTPLAAEPARTTAAKAAAEQEPAGSAKTQANAMKRGEPGASPVPALKKPAVKSRVAGLPENPY